jgi:ribonuclease P protein component
MRDSARIQIEPSRMTARAIIFRLRKHADYQRVYKASRKQFAKQMSYFFTLRPQLGPDGTPLREANPTTPRVGLTVGKVMGKAVDRNRIKRRLREAVRSALPLLTAPVDVILHPRRAVIDLDFVQLKREVSTIFRGVQAAYDRRNERRDERPAPRQRSAPATVPNPS